MLDPQKTTVRDAEEVAPAKKITGNSYSALSVVPYFPFALKRVFILEATISKVLRGSHAHENCAQAFILQKGDFQIEIFDSIESRLLNSNPNTIYLVPPGIWVNITLDSNSNVVVLCDQLYDEHDYMRDWDSFSSWKRLE